jgi:hypothetical protein
LAISIEVLNAEEHGYWAEELLAVDSGGARDAGEDGGLEVVACAKHALAAGEDARPDPACRFHLLFEEIDGARGCKWADLGLFLHGVAHADRLHECDEAGLEDIVDLVSDNETFCSDTGLAAVDTACADGDFDGEV